MSSTNKTPNYKLSQYVGKDKPTYLGDYNGDMLKIDTQMKNNSNDATSAISQAGEAVAKVTALQTKVDEATTSVTELSDQITTLKNSVNTNTGDISGLKNRVTALETKASTLDNQIQGINNTINTQWLNSTNVINTSIPSLSVGNSFMYVGYNKLTQMLSIYFSITKTSSSPVSGGQVLGTIPQEILSEINFTTQREIINGCTSSILSGSILYDVSKNLVINPDGTIAIRSTTGATQYLVGNLMLNTSAWN